VKELGYSEKKIEQIKEERRRTKNAICARTRRAKVTNQIKVLKEEKKKMDTTLKSQDRVIKELREIIQCQEQRIALLNAGLKSKSN